jgi:hypothetical protein
MKNISIDIQLHQFINLIVLFVLGYYFAHIYLSFTNLILLLGFTFIVEHILIYIRYKQVSYISYASLSTAMGVGMMMVSTHIYLLMILIFLALLQKHFIRYQDIHYFNPSNFALISGLLLFYNHTHIVLGQLGDDFWFQAILILMAIAILSRVDRWLIPVIFVITYIAFEYYFVVCYDPIIILDNIIDRFYSVSFILFILFMLTDPKTTPKSYIYQILFAMLISLSSALMDRFYGWRVEHLFEVLFIITPIFALNKKIDKINILIVSILFVLSTSAIIYIQLQPPYYFEMDS